MDFVWHLLKGCKCTFIDLIKVQLCISKVHVCTRSMLKLKPLKNLQIYFLLLILCYLLQPKPTLDWGTRKVKSCKGLLYLHEQCDPKIIHMGCESYKYVFWWLLWTSTSNDEKKAIFTTATMLLAAEWWKLQLAIFAELGIDDVDLRKFELWAGFLLPIFCLVLNLFGGFVRTTSMIFKLTDLLYYFEDAMWVWLTTSCY